MKKIIFACIVAAFFGFSCSDGGDDQASDVKTTTLHGTVQGTEGTVSGVTVTMYRWNVDSYEQYAETTTNPEGEYLITGIAFNEGYMVKFHKDGYITQIWSDGTPSDMLPIMVIDDGSYNWAMHPILDLETV